MSELGTTSAIIATYLTTGVAIYVPSLLISAAKEYRKERREAQAGQPEE